MTAPPRPLAPGDVHVWYAFPERCQAQLPAYRDLLSDEERARLARFATTALQREYLVARALCRHTLSRYAAIAPHRWRFGANAHGRPHVANAEAPSWLRFNLSHARSLVACAVACDAEVGVDVEETDRGIEALELAERFFAPSEVAHLRAAPSDVRDERFFTLWTLKEAYIKALGTGLSTDLKAFAIDPVRPGFADGDDRWHFAAAAPTPSHALAICVRRTDAAPNLLLRETVPGAH